VTNALIVDDKLENLYLLRALLAGHGFEVSEAGNGAEALAVARLQPPDIVISDLLMPVMDGYTLLREWKADAVLAGIPFIVYTATYTEPKDEKLALDLGANAFIVKPAEPEPFMQCVREVLMQARSGVLSPSIPATDEQATLKLYNEVLVEKLEKKSAQLEQRVAELAASEEQIRHLNNMYALLSETNQAIVHLGEPDALFQAVCRTAIERGGLAMAWIGMIDPGSGEIVPVAWNDACEGWFARIRPFRIHGSLRTPSEFAAREERVYLCNDFDADSALAPIRYLLSEAGLQSTISLPLRRGGEVVGVLTLFAYQKNYFDSAMSALASEIANDISFALDNFAKEDQLRASEESNRLSSRAIEAAANGIMITRLQQQATPIIYINPAFERITGYGWSEAIGCDPGILLRHKDREQFGLSEIRAAIRERREGTAVLRNYRKDGSLFWNELIIAPVFDASGTATHFVGVINDVTERKQYEQQLEQQNNQDPLTGLASRNLLRDRTEQAITFASYKQRAAALLLIDLDNFKRINDSLGHPFGDKLLRVIGGRIAGCVADRDTVARLGGDEFMVVLPDLPDPQSASPTAIAILRAISQPINIENRQIEIHASIGVSVFPEDGGDYDTLLRNADTAMYHAKDTGRNAFHFYTADMNDQALRRLDLEANLRQALERDEFQLHYQIMLDPRSNRATEVEALLRWRGENGQMVMPADFIPLAEETGLIIPIGEWVLKTACWQARRWLDAGLELHVGVNLSARQFRDSNLVTMVRGCIEESGLPPSLLRLEITESVAMDNAREAARIMAELKSIGLGLSIDDFGTGFSSLAYLHRFPIDQIKIDRSFVQDIFRHPGSGVLIHGIIGLARNLHIQTVAEGVETPEQRDFLKTAGCDLMQGYLFSQPLPPEEVPAALN